MGTSDPLDNESAANDSTEPRPSRRSPSTNPFTSSNTSRSASSAGVTTITSRAHDERHLRYFHSRRVPKGKVEMPWLTVSNPKEKWVTILPILGIMVGLGISGFLVWDGLRSVVKHEYCPVLLLEDFSRGLDDRVWTKEVELGGFGNGEFGMTTTSEENIFIRDNHLIIRATLQDASLIEKDSTVDLLSDGTCTSDEPSRCIAVTNTTIGNATIVPPARTGRLNTRRGASIRYGRVEVTARLPQGDWLWPAIWMMPVDDTYGPWPASGEIDILEARGNNYTYRQGGNNIMSSALHWGPDSANNAWWRTNNKRRALRTTYSAKFHTFGLEWSEKYLFTYVDSRLLQVLYTNFEKPLWQRGNFPHYDLEGEPLHDPWSHTGRPQTPFDQPFYLVLNVAVGANNGWFENEPGKPWRDGSDRARKDFWDKRGDWFATWTKPEMEVSSVKMWQQCDGHEGEL